MEEVVRLRTYSYEILCVSFNLALLGFLGLLSFFPFEIMFAGQQNYWYLGILIIAIAVLISFFYFSVYWQRMGLLMMRFADFISIIILILTLINFIEFTPEFLDTWFTQFPWYLRKHGDLIGLYAAFAVFKSVAGLTFLISKFRIKNENEIDFGKFWKVSKNQGEYLILLLLVFSLAFGGLMLFLFRYASGMDWMIFVGMIHGMLFILSFWIFSKEDYEKYMILPEFKKIEKKIRRSFKDHEKNAEYNIDLTNIDNAIREESEINNINAQNYESKIFNPIIRFVNKCNNRLECVGTNKHNFWFSAIPFFASLIFGIFLLSISPVETMVRLKFNLGEIPVDESIPAAQLGGLGLIVIIFIFNVIAVFEGRSFRRFKDYYEEGYKRFFKIYGIGLLDGMRVLGIITVASQILYFFDYPIYFPRVLIQNIIFIIIGVILYWFIGKKEHSKEIRNLLYIGSIIALIINIILVYFDIMDHPEYYYSGDYDLIFPYSYLHSIYNSAMVGLSLGILLTDIIKSLIFENTDSSNPVDKAVFLTLAPFFGGMLLILGNWALSLPGGAPLELISQNIVFTGFSLGFILILILGLIYYLYTEIILPKKLNRRGKLIIRRIYEIIIDRKKILKPLYYVRKSIIIIFIGFLILSTGGVYTVEKYYENNYQKPIIAEGDGWYIWMANSSERISKESHISYFSSPRVDSLRFTTAKGEYNAFQFVLYTDSLYSFLRDPNKVSITIPDFETTNNTQNSDKVLIEEYKNQIVSYIERNSIKIKNAAISYNFSNFFKDSDSVNASNHDKNPDNELIDAAIISSDNFSLRHIDYVIENEVPDMLVDFSEFSIKPRENSIFWFSTKVPADISSGEFFGNLTFFLNITINLNQGLLDEFIDFFSEFFNFTSSSVSKAFSSKSPVSSNSNDNYSENDILNSLISLNLNITIPIELNVWDFSLEPSFTTYKSGHTPLKSVFGLSSDDYSLIENYVNHKSSDYGVPIYYTDNYSIFMSDNKYLCYLNKTSGAWQFRWEWWDNLTAYKLSKGMQVFGVNYPLGIADNGRIPYLNDSKRMNWLAGYLSTVQDHLESKGWLKYAYHSFIDEFIVFIPEGYTRQGYFSQLLELIKFMKEVAPKIRIRATVPPTPELKPFEDYIDIYVPISSDYNKEQWKRIKSMGKELWFYAAVAPNSPYPNSHLYNRLHESRILIGWQSWLYGVDGFLYWQTRGYWHGKHGFAFNGYGDGWLIYTRNNKYYDSLRWENYLEGIEDYQYLHILNATIWYFQTKIKNSTLISANNSINESQGNLLSKINNQIAVNHEILTKSIASVTGENWNYSDKPSSIYKARERVGTQISETVAFIRELENETYNYDDNGLNNITIRNFWDFYESLL